MAGQGRVRGAVDQPCCGFTGAGTGGPEGVKEVKEGGPGVGKSGLLVP